MRPVIWIAIDLGVGTLAGVLCWLWPGPLPVTPPGDPEDGPAWFEDVTASSGIEFVHDAGPIPVNEYFLPQIMGSGAAILDFDGDGLFDIYLLTTGGPNSRSVNRLYQTLVR